MSDLWPWLALAGLGVFHGVNPAMGWLFAVALGLHRGRRAVLFLALLPIALGHAAAVLLVALAVVALGVLVDLQALRLVAGLALLGWALAHQLRGGRHPVQVGMRTGMAGLALWSFVMAGAHGAGLMLVPVLLPLGVGGGAGSLALDRSLLIVLAAVALHSLAMLLTTGAVAVIVHDWVGLAFLRRGWVNLDLVWTAALAVTGLVLLAT